VTEGISGSEEGARVTEQVYRSTHARTYTYKYTHSRTDMDTGTDIDIHSHR